MPVTYNVDPESGIVHLDFFGQVSVTQRIAAYEQMRDEGRLNVAAVPRVTFGAWCKM